MNKLLNAFFLTGPAFILGVMIVTPPKEQPAKTVIALVFALLVFNAVANWNRLKDEP